MPSSISWSHCFQIDWQILWTFIVINFHYCYCSSWLDLLCQQQTTSNSGIPSAHRKVFALILMSSFLKYLLQLILISLPWQFLITTVLQKLFIRPVRVCSFLTHFSPVSHFYTSWKRQKTKGFLTFSGGIEMWHWTKMG